MAGNLLLGQETRGQVLSTKRFYERAGQILDEFEIPIEDITQRAGTLSGGQRGLLALAMALLRAAACARARRADGRHGRLGGRAAWSACSSASARAAWRCCWRRVTSGRCSGSPDGSSCSATDAWSPRLEPQDSHPDDVAALLAGGTVDGSARRQLTRLHGLADSLAVADPSSGLSLIISALAAALDLDRGRIDVVRANATVASAERVIVDGETWLVPVVGPGGTSAMVTIGRDSAEPPTRDELDLLGLYAGYAAAALERQETEEAQREAAALRRSRELQRQFLSRLSHELRTPLTAIRGYASSLLAPDITWDDESQQRFLETIATESSRLGRLVDDLLDFSAIDSGVMRMQFDWCQLDLVIDAAIACLPDAWRDRVSFEPVGLMPADLG